VAKATAHAGLDTSPEVVESLAHRALTPEAEIQVRASGLQGGRHQHAWMALHAATNPEVLAAAVNTLERARYAFAPHADDFLDRARQRISGA
jgi:hypothetical protein